MFFKFGFLHELFDYISGFSHFFNGELFVPPVENSYSVFDGHIVTLPFLFLLSHRDRVFGFVLVIVSLINFSQFELAIDPGGRFPHV